MRKSSVRTATDLREPHDVCILLDATRAFPIGVRDKASPFWLARALAEAAFEIFKSEDYGEEWLSQNFELQGPLKINHKEESFDFGAEACYVKHSNSLRPAFVVEAHREDVVTQLMYVYIPMGLEREHEMQGSVLARFCSHELASCYLAVASEQLEMGYTRDVCTCTIPEEARKHGSRMAILEKWEALINSRKLRPCYSTGQPKLFWEKVGLHCRAAH